MPKFYGPLEIESESLDPATNIITITTVKDPESHVERHPVKVPKVMYDMVVTDIRSDWTSLRDKRAKIIVGDVLAALLKWNAYIDEVEFIFGMAAQSINNTREAADALLWGNGSYERSFLDLDRVVRQIPNKKSDESRNTSNSEG